MRRLKFRPVLKECQMLYVYSLISDNSYSNGQDLGDKAALIQ